MMSEPTWVTVKRAALLRGVDVKTIRRWVRLGMIAHDRSPQRASHIRIYWPLRWLKPPD